MMKVYIAGAISGHDPDLVHKKFDKVFIYDRSYYNQIISKYPISVVGHMRNQRFGKGNQQTKLIYINPYEKKGRITRAKKNLRNKN